MTRTLAPDPADRSIELEMHALARQHEGVIHQLRLERIGAQAAATAGGVAVQHSTSGWCGDRLSLFLDDGRLVKLHLYWPRRQPIVAILGVRWTERVGWVVQVRTTAGERIPVFAWRGRVFVRCGPDGRGEPPAWSLLGGAAPER